jgi:RHS repeat-associated protein
MTTNSSVSSNALNFMSALKNGVDPRTGLYTVSVNFPEIQTNDLRGPGFGLALAYSPLNTQDSGYGYGWNLQLSQYTLGKQILSLSTGETFKVTGSDSVSGQLLMKEKKLDSFHFYQESSTRYRVMHKSGMVEILEVHGSTQNRVALPVEIHLPSGHKVTLGYRTFSADHQILDWVKDDTGQTLLTIKRDSVFVDLLLHPYGGPDGGPLARFVMTLGGTSKYVTRITLPTDNQASWRFEYRLINDHLCMSAVETPGGGREELFYQDLGHPFPASSGRTPLPRVTRQITYPGFEQPPIDVRFTYKRDAPGQGEKNFLGYGLTIPWSDDGLDNLYKYIGTYEYACVETLWVDEKPVRKIERTFNQFHLLTSEATTQNNNVETVETTYFLTPNVSYDEQPSYCQMPKSIRTIWSVLDNPNRRRSETVSRTYDNFGNLLTQTQANGIVETNTWYSAAGGDGCPPDPEGFVRHIKDKTVTPAPSGNGQAPTLRTRYRYKALPPLAGSPLKNWLTVESETLVQMSGDQETELERTLLEHTDAPNDAFLHGRVKRQTVTLNNKSTFVDYDYRRLISRQLNAPVQQTTETLTTDFDDVSKAIVRQHSLITSLELLSRSDGVETHFQYDVLNRLTTEIIAPGTAYEARRQYEYVLSAASGQKIEYIVINARQIKTRSVFDGLGRLIFQERDHVDSTIPSRAYQTFAAQYDAWNNLIEQTEFDWLEGVALPLTSRFYYDDWEQQNRVVSPDGVEAHQSIDPIGTEQSQGPIHRSWSQSTGPAPSVIGLNETWMNLFGKPSRTVTLDATQAEIASETFLYDGLGRSTQHSDPLQYVTQFDYDARSRLISSTLPDETLVKRTYAAHSASELPVALSVNGDGSNEIAVGEQEFDGLGRLTRTTNGQRTERYAYEGDRLQVKQKTTPANQIIEYDYNLLLTEQPVSISAPDENASFVYDTTSARLTQARNEQGSREYDYDTANQLVSERWVDQQGKTWETVYSSSMQGRLLKRTEAKQAGDSGLDTVYEYDAVGRVKRILQGQLQVDSEYNNLGQPSKTTTRDLTANTTLVTELKYDDQGREILRTLTQSGQPPRTLQQIWQIDGLLESRHQQQSGTTLLKETFSYDRRGRLTRHDCEGSTLPRDSEGRAFKRQVFSFDALDNIRLSLTTFIDDTSERAVFTYATDDPCQLQRIAYTPSRATADPVFTYDLNGCLQQDERGQRLVYDSQNRLLNVESSAGQTVSRYRYDGHDHLITSQHGNASETLRFYQEEQLSLTVQDDRHTQLLYHFDQPLGQQVATDQSQTLLLQTDANHSVIAESQQNNLRTAVYSAYGERHGDSSLLSLRAFNGEVREANGWYLLGRGYRAYNPGLMRFHSPDSLSPFGSGGVNPYMYCRGNPIALRDPTGHSAIGYNGRPRRPDEDDVTGMPEGGVGAGEIVSLALGAVFVVGGAILTAVTFGGAAPITVPVMVKGVSALVGTGLAAGSLAASTVAVVNKDPVAAKVATGLNIASAVASLPYIAVGVFKTVSSLAAGTTVSVASRASSASLSSSVARVASGGQEMINPLTFRIPRPQLLPTQIASTSAAQSVASVAVRSQATQTAPIAAQPKPPAANIPSGSQIRPAITPAVLAEQKLKAAVPLTKQTKKMTDLEIAVTQRKPLLVNSRGEPAQGRSINVATALANKALANKDGTPSGAITDPNRYRPDIRNN